MGLGSSLSRIERQLAAQETATLIETARRAHVRHGLPFTAEDQADMEAYARWKRTWPPGLDLEAQIRRAAAWWAAKTGVEMAEVIAEAERLVAEGWSPDESA